MLGDHALQFGGSLEQIRVNAYNFASRFPRATFGFSSAAPAGMQLTAAQLPASRCRPDLGEQPVGDAVGRDTSLSQTFQVREPDVGVRRRHSEQPQLEPGQLLAVHPGQLALEAQRRRFAPA